MLPFAFVFLIASLLPIATIRLTTIFMLYALMAAVAIDSFLLYRRLSKLTAARFADKAKGAAYYGMMRSLQMRRWRVPNPQVQRGQFPT